MHTKPGIWNLRVFACCVKLVVWLALASYSSAGEASPPSFSPPPQRVKPKGTDEELYGPFKSMTLKELWQIRSEFFKSGRVPTDTNEVKRLWQWHRTMDEKDPTFGSKTPIEFYGLVVDQYGIPISGAIVDMSWGKGTNIVMKTPPDGLFSISGLSGASLSVLVSKNGHLTGSPPIKSFHYADWFNLYFHLPDPANPVVFRLQKLENPEPMFVSSLRPKVDVAGTAVWVDVASGKAVETGDVGFSVVRDEVDGEDAAAYTLTILSPPGGGVIVTDEEYMFHAPETGYSERLDIRQEPVMSYGQSRPGKVDVKLYLRTADGRYAAMEVTVGLFSRPEAWVDLVISFNPSGSRNLELGNERLDARDTARIRRAPPSSAGADGKP